MRPILSLLLVLACLWQPSATFANPLEPELLRQPAPESRDARPNASPSGNSLSPPARPLGDMPVHGSQLPAPVPQAAGRPASDTFGAHLFTGGFTRQGSLQFNPDYQISHGDQIRVRMWGGYSFDDTLAVDPQGNVFLPQIGPLQIAGTRNSELQATVENAIKRVFRNNVSTYSSLAGAQPVRVFVGGFVYRPGLFHGTSMDSVLHYLDQAGGIDLERGSFLEILVKRGEQVRTRINLYEFLLHGRIPQVQLADGDIIFVAPRKYSVRVRGLADIQGQLELEEKTISVSTLSGMVRPQPHATHVRIIRNTGTMKNVDYGSLSEVGGVMVSDGDEIQFTADKRPGSITVRVEGEHLSAQEYVLPYGTRVGELLRKVSFSDRSDVSGLQLFRHSVRDRQRALLQASMRSLEASVLTARSGTSDEGRLRKDEAELILQWVERAKNIAPSGQVLIAHAREKESLLLENGDIIRVPTRDGLVLVGGEVLFPNAIAHDTRLTLADYIQGAGGYTQNADNSRVLISHRDGSFTTAETSAILRPGDEILVLPKVDVKSRQIWKDLTQIIFQIAVSAKVVFGL